MNSHNNYRNRGSALAVTIMLTTVMLLMALVLLDRIIPYARSVRSMHDAVQARYSAQGEIEKGVYRFQNQSNRLSPDININNIGNGTDGVFSLPIMADTRSNRIIASAQEIPLKIKLYESDLNEVSYGTSRSDQTYHTLDPASGFPLRFDLRGVDTSSLTLNIKPISGFPSNGILKAKLETGTKSVTVTQDYSKGPGANLDLATLKGNDGSAQIKDIDCKNEGQQCDLFLSLEGAGAEAFDFTLSASEPIPDINAVIVGEAVSNNREYYQRIIHIEQTKQ